MGYRWRLFITSILANDIGCISTEVRPNFTDFLSETLVKLELKGQLSALHVSYITLGFLSLFLMFGLSILLLSEHQWCKKNDEEDTKTMELVPQNIFEVTSHIK